MTVANLLYNEPPIAVSPSLAAALGINSAILLQQLHFLINGVATAEVDYNHIDGRYWIYNSYPDWRRKYFPWLSESTIKRLFLELEGQGIVLSMQSVKDPSDRRKWYSIDYDAYTRFVETMGSKWSDGGSDQNSPMVGSKWSDGSYKTIDKSNAKEKDSSSVKMTDGPANLEPSPNPAPLPAADSHDDLLEAAKDALHFGEGSYPLVAKYVQFLTGAVPDRDKKGRDNGDWYAYQIGPPMTAVEIRAFGLWLSTHYQGEPLRKAATLNDYVGRFRAHEDHDYLMAYTQALPELEAVEAALLETPDDGPAIDPLDTKLFLDRMRQSLNGNRHVH